MLRVHHYDPDDAEDYDTTCGRNASSTKKTTDEINETTCTTCLKRLHTACIWQWRHHRKEYHEAADRVSAVRRQRLKMENK